MCSLPFTEWEVEEPNGRSAQTPQDAWRAGTRLCERRERGKGAWAAAEMQAVNATVFAGRAGEALVFNAQGQVFRGNVGNTEQFTRTAQGLVANFEKLNQIVR